MVVVHQVPIPPPHRNAAELTRPTLTEQHQTKLDIVMKHFSGEYKLPDVEEDKQSLMEEEQYWLSRECMLRYLRAAKWDEKSAMIRLEATLKWRREFGFYDQMTNEYVEPQALTGKELVFGYDVDGRPALYMFPSRQNTDATTAEKQRHQLQFAVWVMERAFDLLPVGVENIAFMIDFSDKAKSPSLSTSRYMLSYLQNHYPERLGRGLVLNVPYLVSLFFKVMMPLVDPVTREKIKFNPEVVKDGMFTADQVITKWGGKAELPYEHEVYWPALIKMCKDRHQRRLEKWRSLGGTVGLSEWDVFQDDSDVMLVQNPEKGNVAQEAPATVDDEKKLDTAVPAAVEAAQVVA
ncbi:hypothetical protein FRB98_007383 [Tulasnella sp. 332]|nr:hypothetical protein FRB98_007383 [Tulasnella sp. 332]